MTRLIQTEPSTIVQTWIDAVKYLRGCDQHYDFNVILEIDSPMTCLDTEKKVLARIDSFYSSHNSWSLNTIANTIFPYSLYRQYGTTGIYDMYPDQVYPRIMRCKENRWGTYAYRLVHRADAKGHVINPLKTVINRLKQEATNRGPKRARYELNLVEPFTDLSTSDPTLAGDNLALGGPCLSHLSFKLRPGGILTLSAFYRSHFYIERALGNLIGLARLLKFAATESGLQAGSITCISSYAQIDTNTETWNLTEVDRLISECKRFLSVSTTAPNSTATAAV